jgi:hypothetical protein
MERITYDIVQEIAKALDSQNHPPVKAGVTYRIVVFVEKIESHYVVAMIPDIISVEELFMVLNESYDKFLNGELTPNGITFISAAQPEELTTLAKHWYYDNNETANTH